MTKYFAQIDANNIVTEVIVAEQEFIDSGAAGNPSVWIECSSDGAFRNAFPGVGHYFDSEKNVFYQQSPFPSWGLDNNFNWVAPIPRPEDGKIYNWDEDAQQWIELI